MNFFQSNMDHKNDLPLMSNTKDIGVYHYVLDLTCNFDAHQMQGYITLFLSPRSQIGLCSSQIFSIKEYSVPQRLTSNCGDHTEEYAACDPTCTNEDSLTCFELVLDSCDLQISEVEEIVLDECWNVKINNLCRTHKEFDCEIYRECKNAKKQKINFKVEKWCIKIWKEGIKSGELFPRIIRITYNSLAKGASLRWVHDQENKLVFCWHVMILRNIWS